MAEVTVSASEVEQFKRERAAETIFLAKLQVLVKELQSQVSPKNRVYASMARFLKGNV